MKASVLGSTILVLVSGCRQGTDLQENSHDLARTAVHAALEGGAFEALIEQATASAFAVARARIEGTGQSLTTDQAQRLEALLRRVLGEVYSRDAWEEALLPVVLDSFDRDEMRQVIDFAHTPFGRKLLEIQARLATGGGVLGERLMQSRQGELSRRLGLELNEILGPSR